MTTQWPAMIRALQDPSRYSHSVAAVTVVETHISYVLLTGAYAYKVKKSVDLGFVDFSTLAKRRHACDEEVRINARTAPELYLGVVAITGSEAEPKLDGDGAPFEYAVQMRQFPDDARLDHVLEREELAPEHMDALARRVAELHREAAGPPADADYGTPAEVAATMRANFAELRAEGSELPVDPGRIDALERWFETFESAAAERLRQRSEGGGIRECHGDLHLANMALLSGDVVPFDAIEFDPELRFTDVMADVAFTVMDLDYRGRPDLGWRFLNRYLEGTGDYAGVAVLPFYKAYRALVRAKVEVLQARDAADPEPRRAAAARFVALAEGYTQPGEPLLVITRGVTGVGKSLASGGVLPELGAVRIRSDVERKRLAGLDPEADAGAEVGGGLYAEGMSERTYARLLEQARPVLAAGIPVVLDATYLAAERRAAARNLAAELGVPFAILALEAPEAQIRAWLRERAESTTVSDGDEAVLDHHLATAEPLDSRERGHTLRVDTRAALDFGAIAADLRETAAVPDA